MNLRAILAVSILALASGAHAAEGEPRQPVAPEATPQPAPTEVATASPVGVVEPAPPPRPLFGASDGGWAFVGRIGTFVPTLGKFKAFHAANAAELGLRRRVGSAFAFEAAAGIVSTSTDAVIHTTGLAGPETWTIAELTVAPMTLGARAAYRAGPVELFASAGGGVYWCQLYRRADVEVQGTLSKAFQPGFYAATGTGFQLTPAVTLSYELRYTYLKPTFFGVDSRIDGFGLTAVLAYGF